ncbi:hypothetical protein MRI28_03630 [Nocardiopsis dassonvillei]|uniref:hypothetical protein n=1 Tax=Nocardiopsis dassonvillei TaxID=2014 RepID=UPI00200C2250|nr:hypothetical protein [Nocardiopsis dassonvillei]MCK9868751.1 hypothetical protein [Nocardiopsis dassonvillei]
MAVPTMGLNEGDPRQLGGYRLLGRVRDSSLGVVYLGRDGSGNQVSVAVLDSGAAGDGGARERFAEAVRRSDFLKVAARSGRAAARGPVVMPHWAGSRGPVSVRWAPWAGRRDSAVAAGESNWWLIGGLGLVLVLILLLVSLLYWWMLQFPPPEMPSPAQPPEAQESPESPRGPGTLPGEEEGEDGGAEPTPVVPTPGEGDGEWGDNPEDNL